MKCRICESSALFIIRDLGDQPLANKYPTKDQFKTEDLFPLNVIFCHDCKCVQLERIIDRKLMFVDYYYLSSVNQGLVRHFDALATEIANTKPSLVVDIGSNDGILLRPLKNLGIKAVGVEPSENVSKIAIDNGFDTINAFFDKKSRQTILDKYGHPDVIVASSVFTHLEHPHTFVEDVRHILTDNGKFIVEVEYIKNIIDTCQFERFYFDRIFYYSLTSLVALFKREGMKIVDAEIVETHGGSLRIVGMKDISTNPEPSDRFKELVKSEDTLNVQRMREFRQEMNTNGNKFLEMLTLYKSQDKKIAGYGAPARVSTICNYLHIGTELIDYIVDDSPLKQNRYSPGTHIPIMNYAYYQQHQPDVLVVFAWEYMNDIVKKTPGVKYVTPIPYKETDSTLPRPPNKEVKNVIVDGIINKVLNLDELIGVKKT